MDLAHELKGVKEIVLLTADTDFVPLVNRLQDKKLSVVALGNESDPSSAVYREHADLVISVTALRAALAYEGRGHRGKKKPHEKLAAPETEAETPTLSQDAPPPALSNSTHQTPASPLPVASNVAPNPSVADKPVLTRKQRLALRRDFDHGSAAKSLISVAAKTPNRAISRATVERAMMRMKGFTRTPTTDHEAWLGCGNYEGMLRKLAEFEPGLSVSKTKESGLHVRFVGELPSQDEPATPAASIVASLGGDA